MRAGVDCLKVLVGELRGAPLRDVGQPIEFLHVYDRRLRRFRRAGPAQVFGDDAEGSAVLLVVGDKLFLPSIDAAFLPAMPPQETLGTGGTLLSPTVAE